MSKPKAVIFDFDGTLMDSEVVHLQLYQALAQQLGLTLTTQTYHEQLIGQTDEAIIGKWAEQLGREAEKGVFLAGKQQQFYARLSAGQIPPIDGAVAFVQRLSQQGYHLAVGTSAISSEVMMGLQGLGLTAYFETVVSADMVTAGKPAPDIYLKVLERLNLSAKDCLVFEDSIAGVRAAERAGIPVIGVGSNHPQHLLHAGAMAVIPNFLDKRIIEWLLY